MDVFFTVDFHYVGVTSQVLSGFPKLCDKETMKLDLFVTKPYRRWVLRGSDVENSGVKTAPWVLVEP